MTNNKGYKYTTATGLIVFVSTMIAEKIITPAESLKNGVQTNKHRVQLRQEVVTQYPAARGNELFAVEEMGLGKGQSFTEKRVTWLNVPATATIEEVQKRLEQMDQPTLVRTLDLAPILSQDQLNTIERGINPKSYNDYLNDWVPQADGQTPALFKGQKQYRRIDFSKSFHADVDKRAESFAAMPASAVQLASGEPAKVGAKI